MMDPMATNVRDKGNDKFLQKCRCGCQKVPSLMGLHMYQGRKHDQHDRTTSADQTRRGTAVIKWLKVKNQEKSRLDEHLNGILEHSLKGSVECKLKIL